MGSPGTVWGSPGRVWGAPGRAPCHRAALPMGLHHQHSFNSLFHLLFPCPSLQVFTFRTNFEGYKAKVAPRRPRVRGLCYRAVLANSVSASFIRQK